MDLAGLHSKPIYVPCHVANTLEAIVPYFFYINKSSLKMRYLVYLILSELLFKFLRE